MKLLIVCQALDRNHPILGFFHRWVEEFAKHCESVVVVASFVGVHHLPANVTIHSLGKERNNSSPERALRLLHLSWKLRKQYDAVFVHMIPEFILLCGLDWRLMGKKVGLWYNHAVGSIWLRLAQPLTHQVFYTSPHAFTARYKNAERMPAGIDTDVFKPQPHISPQPKSVYYQGRIAPAKRVHILLEAFSKLHSEGRASLLTLVGPEDATYTTPLKEQYTSLIAQKAIVFKGPVPNIDTPALFAAHSVSVNLTDRGNYDKTVLESLACNIPVVVASEAFSDLIPSEYITATPSSADSLAVTLRHALAIQPGFSVRDRVIAKHGISALARSVLGPYQRI